MIDDRARSNEHNVSVVAILRDSMSTVACAASYGEVSSFLTGSSCSDGVRRVRRVADVVLSATLCSSSSSVTSIFGPAAASGSDADMMIFLLLALLLEALVTLRALGHMPLLSSHWSHFGATGAHMV